MTIRSLITNPSITSPERLAGAREREAAQLLWAIVDALHVKAERPGRVTLEGELPAFLFDRLCLWGAAQEDCEPEEDRDASDEPDTSAPGQDDRDGGVCIYAGPTTNVNGFEVPFDPLVRRTAHDTADRGHS